MKKSRIIEVSSVHRVNADRLWSEVDRPRLMQFVVGGRLKIRPVEPESFPESWKNEDYLVALYGFGVVPMGRQTICIEHPPGDGSEKCLRDKGGGRLFMKWDHWIIVQPLDASVTRYTDRVEFTAGFLTPLLIPFVRNFFRYRQERLGQLVANNFEYPDP